MATLDLAAIGKLTIKVKTGVPATAKFTNSSSIDWTTATVSFVIKKGLTSTPLNTLTVGSGVTILSASQIAVLIPGLAHAYDYYYYDMTVTTTDSKINIVDKIYTVYE